MWTTCLVFFQSALLLGYAYADFCVRRLTPRAQVATAHRAAPVEPASCCRSFPARSGSRRGWKIRSWLILGLLAATIGLPYFLLSTTSPLIQAWFARERPGTQPLSSVCAVQSRVDAGALGYPFLLEPWVATRTQAWSWSAGYVLFAVLCVAAAAQKAALAYLGRRPSARRGCRRARGEPPPRRSATSSLWCALAATGSLLLLAVSPHLTQNIAAVPLLWIVPLSIYLLTFILCFDGSGWYRRRLFLPMLAACLVVMAWTLADPKLTYTISRADIGVFVAGLFLACMFCHGELVTLKPAPQYLTRFYLMISLGGAVGSVAGRHRRAARAAARISSSPSASPSARRCCCGRCDASGAVVPGASQ